MKYVCMIVMSRYPNDGRVRREAEALRDAGYGVDILCLRGDGETRTETSGSITAYRIMRERDKEHLVGYLALSVLFTIWATVRLWMRSSRRRYDLIHVHNMPDYLVLCGLGHKVLGRPVVLDLHDLSVELLDSKWGGRKSAVLKPIVRLGEKICCRLATHLISTSPGFEERLIERGNNPDRMTMILNTADPRIFEPADDRRFEPIVDGVRLLYHGTVAERFGLVLAVEAVARLRDLLPGSTLHVYGKYDPSCRRQMEERIDRYGLQEAVFLGGWKSFEEIRDIIAASDIGIVPYLKNDFMELALSTKTFEYAASGLPVVASQLKPVMSVFGDDAVTLFEPGDADHLAKKIAEVCADPVAREQRAARAAKAVEAISGAVMAERYVALVERLTDSGA